MASLFKKHLIKLVIKGLFQLKWFYDSVIHYQNRNCTLLFLRPFCAIICGGAILSLQ